MMIFLALYGCTFKLWINIRVCSIIKLFTLSFCSYINKKFVFYFVEGLTESAPVNTVYLISILAAVIACVFFCLCVIIFLYR